MLFQLHSEQVERTKLFHRCGIICAQFAKGGKGPNQNVTKLDRSSDELMSVELEHLAGLYCMEEQKYVHNPSCYFADDQKTAYFPM